MVTPRIPRSWGRVPAVVIRLGRELGTLVRPYVDTPDGGYAVNTNIVVKALGQKWKLNGLEHPDMVDAKSRACLISEDGRYWAVAPFDAIEFVREIKSKKGAHK